MLRRVARVLRIGFLLIGLAFLALIPFSAFVHFGAQTSWPGERVWVVIHLGRFEVTWVQEAPGWPLGDTGWGFTYEGHRPLATWVPRVRHETPISGWSSWSVVIPLWLLAFLCLAWPVTSFVIARRRRRGQGFPVEAKADSAVSTVDS